MIQLRNTIGTGDHSIELHQLRNGQRLLRTNTWLSIVNVTIVAEICVWTVPHKIYNRIPFPLKIDISHLQIIFEGNIHLLFVSSTVKPTGFSASLPNLSSKHSVAADSIFWLPPPRIMVLLLKNSAILSNWISKMLCIVTNTQAASQFWILWRQGFFWSDNFATPLTWPAIFDFPEIIEPPFMTVVVVLFSSRKK